MTRKVEVLRAMEKLDNLMFEKLCNKRGLNPYAVLNRKMVTRAYSAYHQGKNYLLCQLAKSDVSHLLSDILTEKETREENTGVKNAAVSPIPDTFSSGQRFVDLSVHLESRVNHPDIVPLTALRVKLDFGIITMREDEPSPTSQLRNHFWATGIPNGRSADLCLRSASRIKNF